MFTLGLVTHVVLAVCFLNSAVTASHQTYPGTSSRPVLSDNEAEIISESNYLHGWSVETISLPTTPDYIVGNNQAYTDIQAAVNAAINGGGTARKYIEIQPGTYQQTVFIKGDVNVPITIYGSGTSPSNVLITLSQASGTSVADWINQVNPDGSRYVPGDPAYSIYNKCASKNGTIGTTCSSIIWINSDNVQLYNLQVTNSYKESGEAQAVAVKIDADKVHLSNVNLLSRQDTFYPGSGSKSVSQRVYVDNCYIEGDVDFVFGGASAVFYQTTFYAVSDRHPSGAIVFAPNTAPANSFGFLVVDCTITGDDTFKSTKLVSLARSWDTNTASGQYVPDASPNGQLTIKNTQIDSVINADAPYAASTSSRAFSGNIDPSRNLNDNNFNRFWEYQNTGDVA